MKLIFVGAAAFLAAGPGALNVAAASSLKVRRTNDQRGEVSGEALGQADAKLSSDAEKKSGAPGSTEKMRFLLQTLKQFDNFANQSQNLIEERHEAVAVEIGHAIDSSKDDGVRLALNQSITSNEQSAIETERIYDNIKSFSESLSGVLRAASLKGVGCEQLTCGLHASCTDTTRGAQCVCNEGYVGQGMDCRAPPEFRPRPLIFEAPDNPLKTVALDMSVAVFEQNRIAVVFSDAAKGHVGRIIVGRVREGGLVDVAPPETFTAHNQKAYDPVVQGSNDRRLLVAWRDETKTGTGWVRGAALGSTGIRGADNALSWGPQLTVCRDQAHKMALIALPHSRFALMFPDKVIATQHSPEELFGNSVFAEVGAAGHVAVKGQYRFSDLAVCRLEVTKITPSGFVLAMRAAPSVDEMDTTIVTNQEAMVMYGEAVESDLVFDPNPINLEPTKTQVWSRGVSLISPNTFAYAYQEGTQVKMKMAVISVNPTTHRMQVLQPPVVVRTGFSPYVSMLNVPYTPKDPHTLTYYQSGNSSMVNVCTWDPIERQLRKCEDFTWLSSELKSVHGVHLGGGKSLMVFSSPSGTPFYSVFGLSKK